MALQGRFERVESGRDFEVIVDYAHTPDAIEAVVDSDVLEASTPELDDLIHLEARYGRTD